MNEDTSPATSLLRLTAFLGTAAVLLRHTMGVIQLQPRQAGGFIVLLLAAVSVSLIFMLLLGAVYVGWTAVLIFQLVVRGNTHLLEALRIIRLWFRRVLALELFGWGVIFGLFAVVFSTGLLSISIGLIIIGIAGLLWNLTIAALLPVALPAPLPFHEALRRKTFQ